MSDTCRIEIALRADSLDRITDAEIELLLAILPELITLMQQHDEAEA